MRQSRLRGGALALESVLDLGCSIGVEYFIAARLMKPSGRVTGVDMLPVMLGRAFPGRGGGGRPLGYENLEFKLGFLGKFALA